MNTVSDTRYVKITREDIMQLPPSTWLYSQDGARLCRAGYGHILGCDAYAEHTDDTETQPVTPREIELEAERDEARAALEEARIAFLAISDHCNSVVNAVTNKVLSTYQARKKGKTT